MPWNAGVSGAVPFIAYGMDILMADAAKENFNLNIPLPRNATFKVEWNKRFGGRGNGIGFGFHWRLIIGFVEFVFRGQHPSF